MRRQRSIQLAQHLEKLGIRDPFVLDAICSVDRKCFVPVGWREYAYENHPLPIGYGQTISQPYIVAYMAAALQLRPDDRVLEIGSGSGYNAAVLAQLVQRVYSLEIVPQLAEMARRNLREAGIENVEVHLADGSGGWPAAAPYAAIALTAAPASLPPALVEQLLPGGRIIAPIGQPQQELITYQLDRQTGELIEIEHLPVSFVPMTGSTMGIEHRHTG